MALGSNPKQNEVVKAVKDLESVIGSILPNKLRALASGECVSLTAEDLFGVTEIGSYTFAYNNITDITIPSSVTRIGLSSFTDNRHLTQVTIGNNVDIISNFAFNGCAKLIEIYNLSSLPITLGSKLYGNIAQYAKVIHTSLDEPSVLTKQGDHILYAEGNDVYYVDYVGQSDSVVIPSSVTKIYTYALSSQSLDNKSFSVSIPNGVTSIEVNAFYSRRGLMTITIPSSMTNIGSSAFSNCNKLIEIYNTSSLPITIGASTYGSIAQNAKIIHTSLDEPSVLYTDINGHTTATIDNDVYYMHYSGPIDNFIIPNSVTQIYQYACQYSGIKGSLIIPDSVTVIGSYAFADCYNITSVTIGNGIISIERAAFNNTGPASITITATNPPTLGNANALSNTGNCPIYVPAGSVTAYKTATNWSSLASRIQAIP